MPEKTLSNTQTDTSDLLSATAGLETLEEKVLRLEKQAQYLDSVIEHISEGLFFIDLAGTVSTYNPQAEHLFGPSRQQVLGSSFWDHFPDDLFGFSLKRALREKKAPQCHYHTWKARGHQKKELEIHTTFVLSFDTAQQGLLILIRDVSHLRHLQAAAQQHDRMQELGKLAASVAHEIRNPLGGIEGFASLLAQDLYDQPEKRHMAEQIVAGARTLNHLVSQILEFSRPVQLHLTTQPLGPILEKAVASVRADAHLSKKVLLALRSPYEPIEVPVDPSWLERALLNLILNAYQATPEEGRIDVVLSRDAAGAKITVQDTGTGILPEHCDQLFSPFFTTKAKGTGLGLAEVQKIVQAHGGKIDVQSQVGKGTLFSLYLPFVLDPS